MSNLSVAHLTKCITEKDKYKFTQQYVKEVEMMNEDVYDIVNEVLADILITNTHHPTVKLYALRFFKDLIISAQFQLIDSLDESIIKQIVKISQFDKENKEKLKRGSLYFEQIEKRNKEPELEKISYSFVLFATEIIYVLGTWHAVDENNEKTDYALIYEKLNKSKVPFPASDKDLKFFRAEEKDLFMKNYKEWVAKLPEIEELSDEDDKENLQRSKKSIKSKQVIPLEKEHIEEKEKKAPEKEPVVIVNSQNYNDALKLGYDKNIETTEENTKLENKIKELEIKLEKVTTELGSEKKEKELVNQKYLTLEKNKTEAENKITLLEKKLEETEKKQKETEELRQKLHIESQQQRLLVKKITLEKTEMEEKHSNALKEVHNQLKETQEKVARLEREIEHLNSIKNSYKNIMYDHEKPKEQDKSLNSQEKKVQELEKQIEELVEFYTKEHIQFKEEIKTLKEKNEKLEGQILEKNDVIKNLQLSLDEKLKEIEELKSALKNKEKSNLKQESLDTGLLKEFVTENQQPEKLIDNFYNSSEPELKIPIREKVSNSMSQFLSNQTSMLKKTTISKENSFDTLKSRENNENNEKSRNISLGKTEKSLEKRKQIETRYSNGKTFHFSSNDPYKTIEIQHNNLQKRPYLGLGRNNAHTNSSGDLLNTTPKVMDLKERQEIINKKYSQLNLNRKKELEEQSISKNYGIQTLIPYIHGYFPQNEVINQQKSIFFKSLCLFTEDRLKQPLLKNEMVEVRLINDESKRHSYVIKITNVSYETIKVQIVSSHEEFKMVGEKLKVIYPADSGFCRLETAVKDLNLRYPVISLIVSANLKQKVSNFTYNVALPFTMLEFTEMKDYIPEFCNFEGDRVKILQSEKFIINSAFLSLRECFPYLNIQSKLKSGLKSLKPVEEYWEGTLNHSFIKNIEVYLKMIQVENQVSLEFWFRNDDKMSENYSKVMIQTLMYLLQ